MPITRQRPYPVCELLRSLTCATADIDNCLSRLWVERVHRGQTDWRQLKIQEVRHFSPGMIPQIRRRHLCSHGQLEFSRSGTIHPLRMLVRSGADINKWGTQSTDASLLAHHVEPRIKREGRYRGAGSRSFVDWSALLAPVS